MTASALRALLDWTGAAWSELPPRDGHPITGWCRLTERRLEHIAVISLFLSGMRSKKACEVSSCFGPMTFTARSMGRPLWQLLASVSRTTEWKRPSVDLYSGARLYFLILR